MTTSIIRFTTDRDAVGFDAVADLYGSVGFGTARQYKEDKRYEAAFHSPGSYVFLAIADGERLVGMARAFSDDRICTWIAEICVHPACQSRGIGRQLLDLVITRFDHTAIYTEALPGCEAFFAEQGIQPRSQLVACSRAGQPVVIPSTGGNTH